MTEKRAFSVKLVCETDLMMHQFNGKDQEKELENLPEREQAEKHAYRSPEGYLAVPRTWLKGTFMEAVERLAGRKWRAEKASYAPRVMVEPEWVMLEPQEYEIDRRSVPSPETRGVRNRSFCIRPIIRGWSLSFRLVTTVPDSADSLREKLEYAGREIGMGSNRPNGYGRFKVTEFKEVTP